MAEATKWRPDVPDEAGYWWWWDGTDDDLPVPVDIMWSGGSGSYFASIGQFGWTEPQDVEDMGGFWIRLPEPSTTAEGKRREPIPTTRKQEQVGGLPFESAQRSG